MSENMPDGCPPLIFDPQHSQVITLLAAEALRKVSTSQPPPEPKGEEKISLFWRLFGATLLSILAMAMLTVYQQVTNDLSSLHNELGRVGESRGDLLKKDEFSTQLRTLWGSIKDLQSINLILASMKERDSLLEAQIKSGEVERKELLQQLQQMRERLAGLEGRQNTLPSQRPAVPTSE
jgi:hypothetical protein